MVYLLERSKGEGGSQKLSEECHHCRKISRRFNKCRKFLDSLTIITTLRFKFFLFVKKNSLYDMTIRGSNAPPWSVSGAKAAWCARRSMALLPWRKHWESTYSIYIYIYYTYNLIFINICPNSLFLRSLPCIQNLSLIWLFLIHFTDMKKRRDKIGNNQAITIKTTGIVVDLK